jgi:Phasin protein
MARNRGNVARDRGNHGQDPQQIMNAASSGLTLMSGMAEQNLRQSVTAMDEMLNTLRRAADIFAQQAIRLREQSAALAEETMGNAAELGSRVMRSKDPLEWTEAQSEFFSKQLQAVAEGNRKIGELLMNESTEMASATLRTARQMSRRRAA